MEEDISSLGARFFQKIVQNPAFFPRPKIQGFASRRPGRGFRLKVLASHGKLVGKLIEAVHLRRTPPTSPLRIFWRLLFLSIHFPHVFDIAAQKALLIFVADILF